MNEFSEPPSEWFVKRFGQYSQRVMAALARAGRAAHERSLDAKAGSQLTSNEAYGSFWVILPEELVKQLDFLPGREVIRPKGGRYDLVVFDGTLIFPAKFGRGSSGPHNIRLGQSDFRSRVFSLVGSKPTQGMYEEQLGLDFGVVSQIESVIKDRSFSSATRVLLAAYDVSAQAGLQHVYVGDATLDDSGLVTWHYYEELQLLRLEGEGPAVAGMGALATKRFDDAPIPESDLSLRGPGNSSDLDSDRETEAGTGTEGEADGRP